MVAMMAAWKAVLTVQKMAGPTAALRAENLAEMKDERWVESTVVKTAQKMVVKTAVESD